MNSWESINRDGLRAIKTYCDKVILIITFLAVDYLNVGRENEY